MAALAEHVMLRSATLRFLDSRRAIQESGKHLLEEAIHQVVFPLKTTSDDLPAEKMNLWIARLERERSASRRRRHRPFDGARQRGRCQRPVDVGGVNPRLACCGTPSQRRVTV
jgi:hypothetical protein